MSVEKNKSVVRRFYQGLKRGDLSVLDKTFIKNYVEHSPMPGQAPGVKGAKQMMTMFLKAFPDMHFDIEFMVAEGDLVATRGTASGTHKGDLMGIPPTKKKATITFTETVRIKNGKAVERWENFDALGLMEQLGAIPPAGQQK